MQIPKSEKKNSCPPPPLLPNPGDAPVPHSCLEKADVRTRQSLLSLHMTKSYVRTATRTTLKVEANVTQILNFKANFHTEFEPFFKEKIYANNGGHFKIVSIKMKN